MANRRVKRQRAGETAQESHAYERDPDEHEYEEEAREREQEAQGRWGAKEHEGEERAARNAWFFTSRVNPSGDLPAGLYARAVQSRRAAEAADAGSPTPAQAGLRWLPLGPTVVAKGQASGSPAVSGRINGLAVGPGALRAYAGAANGGIWFTEDGGATWRPLDDEFNAPQDTLGMAATSLSVGCLAVRFGAGAASDQVFVGTGESHSPHDRPGGDGYFGVGIRFSPAGGAPDTWQLEATNLAGHGIFQLAIDPDNPAIAMAATSRGLYRRPPGPDRSTWEPVASPAFTDAHKPATAIIAAGRGPAKRWYAAFWGDKQAYRSADGNTWEPLPGIELVGRTVLAAAPSDPAVLYALTEQGALYRLHDGRFSAVQGVPKALFYGGQGSYDIVLAVDPRDAQTIYLAGDLVWDGDWTCSFYKGTVTGTPGAWAFPFNPAHDVFKDKHGQRDPSKVVQDPTWIGRGIHADAHSFSFATNPDGTQDPTHVWIGTDGGVFASAQGGRRSTFVPRNAGLAITQMTYLAAPAESDAILFAGTQDNGTQRRTGGPVWEVVTKGDGGGVAVDPQDPYRILRQYVHTSLAASTDGGAAWQHVNFPPLTARSKAQIKAAVEEEKNSSFYGRLVPAPPGIGPTRLAYATHRVWLTSDWGKSWFTLPANTNPYAHETPDMAQDVLDGKRVSALAWASPTRLYVATPQNLWRLDQVGDAWVKTALTPDALPAGRFITAIAPDDSERPAFYLTLGGGGHDHVWYFDGTTFRSTGPGKDVLDIPVSAAVVDPRHPDTLYIGSDAGVWRGRKVDTVTWEWHPFSLGLPEAAVTDLALHERSRMLRAATHGRGVWEVPLDPGSTTADPSAPQLYLRVSAGDSGRLAGAPARRLPWIQGAPDPTAPGQHTYHWQSPDIQVRPAGVDGLPTLAADLDPLAFVTTVGGALHLPSRIQTSATPDVARAFVQVHNRSTAPFPGAQVRVLLLATAAAAGLPPLPRDWANYLDSGDTSPAWLARSPWRFADPDRPYRVLPTSLDARISQVAEFVLAPAPGHQTLLALVTTGSGPGELLAGERQPDALVWQTPQAALHSVHLLVATAVRRSATARRRWQHTPQTVTVVLYNPQRKAVHADLVLQRAACPGKFALQLPPSHSATDLGLQGWHRTAPGHYVADDSPAPTLVGLPLPSGGAVSAQLTLELPPGAKPGDRFRFDVLQQVQGRVVGGCTYVVAVAQAE